MPSSHEAASLVREVIANQITEQDLGARWPESVDAPVDLANTRRNVVALYSARRARNMRLARLLEEDLAAAADDLEAGRPMEWFEVEPKWSAKANRYAIGVGAVGSVVVMILGWPPEKWILPLLASLSIVLAAEWIWDLFHPHS